MFLDQNFNLFYVPGVELQTNGEFTSISWSKKPAAGISKAQTHPNNSKRESARSKKIIELMKIRPKTFIQLSSLSQAFHDYYNEPLLGHAHEIIEDLGTSIQLVNTNTAMVLSHKMQVKFFQHFIETSLKQGTDRRIQDKHRILPLSNLTTEKSCKYGVCSILDLLNDCPTSKLQWRPIKDDIIVWLPQQKQTVAQIKEQMQVSKNLVALLSEPPYVDSGMLVMKFPSRRIRQN